MKKIESFKSFSQVQSQLREEAKLKEIASKREMSTAAFNELLSKYNASSINDINEDEIEAFMTELTAEGNAFSAARAEAIAKGEDTFEVDGEELPVEDVDAEDKENAEEFANESVNEATDKKTLELIHIGLGKPKSMPNPVNVYDEWKSIQKKHKLTDKALGDYLTSYFKKDYEQARKFYTSESVVNEASSKEEAKAAKGFKAASKFMAAHPAFNNKTVTDSTVAWLFKEALKAAMIDANFHSEAGVAAKKINFANFSAPTVFIKELGGMPVQIKRADMMEKAIELATAVTQAVKYDGYAIVLAFAQLFADRYSAKNSAAQGLRDLHTSMVAESIEAGDYETRINEGNAFLAARAKAIEEDASEFDFNGKTYPVKKAAKDMVDEGNAFGTARLKAIEAGEDEFEFDGKTYPVKSVDKEDKEAAEDMVDERLDNATMKRMSGLTDTRDLRDFKQVFLSIVQSHIDEGFEFDDVIEFMNSIMRDPNVKAQIKESVDEGNAFGTARLKAIEAGEDEFEFDGKTYPVKSVDKEDKEAAEDMVDEGKKIKMNNLDWGKSTAERNANLDKYDALKTDEEKEDFLRKLKGESVDEGYAERKMDDFQEFVDKAVGKQVRLTIKEHGQTSEPITGRLKEGEFGLHKIDYMGFDFVSELEDIKKGDGMIMGVRPGQFLKWNIGGRRGTEFLIEVL